MSYKKKIPYDQRISTAKRILENYPTRIPVICEKNPNAKSTPDIDKSKYLVPDDLTVSQFVYVIRKRIKLAPEQAIFVFINNTIPPASSTFKEIYSTCADTDGFLYMLYSLENTFG